MDVRNVELMYTKEIIKFGHPPSHLGCGKSGGLYVIHHTNVTGKWLSYVRFTQN